MARNESAEAVGATIGVKWMMTHVEPILQEFSKDSNIVVRESCMEALDAADYWGHSNHPTGEKKDEDTTTTATTSNDEETTSSNNGDIFVQQKALTNCATTATTTAKSNNGNFINHFNVRV